MELYLHDLEEGAQVALVKEQMALRAPLVVMAAAAGLGGAPQRQAQAVLAHPLVAVVAVVVVR